MSPVKGDRDITITIISRAATRREANKVPPRTARGPFPPRGARAFHPTPATQQNPTLARPLKQRAASLPLDVQDVHAVAEGVQILEQEQAWSSGVSEPNQLDASRPAGGATTRSQFL